MTPYFAKMLSTYTRAVENWTGSTFGTFTVQYVLPPKALVDACIDHMELQMMVILWTS